MEKEKKKDEKPPDQLRIYFTTPTGKKVLFKPSMIVERVDEKDEKAKAKAKLKVSSEIAGNVVYIDPVVPLSEKQIKDNTPYNQAPYEQFFNKEAFKRLDEMSKLQMDHQVDLADALEPGNVLYKNIGLTLSTIFQRDTILNVDGELFLVFGFTWDGEHKFDRYTPPPPKKKVDASGSTVIQPNLSMVPANCANLLRLTLQLFELKLQEKNWQNASLHWGDIVDLATYGDDGLKCPSFPDFLSVNKEWVAVQTARLASIVPPIDTSMIMNADYVLEMVKELDSAISKNNGYEANKILTEIKDEVASDPSGNDFNSKNKQWLAAKEKEVEQHRFSAFNIDTRMVDSSGNCRSDLNALLNKLKESLKDAKYDGTDRENALETLTELKALDPSMCSYDGFRVENEKWLEARKEEAEELLDTSMVDPSCNNAILQPLLANLKSAVNGKQAALVSQAIADIQKLKSRNDCSFNEFVTKNENWLDNQMAMARTFPVGLGSVRENIAGIQNYFRNEKDRLNEVGEKFFRSIYDPSKKGGASPTAPPAPTAPTAPPAPPLIPAAPLAAPPAPPAVAPIRLAPPPVKRNEIDDLKKELERLKRGQFYGPFYDPRYQGLYNRRPVVPEATNNNPAVVVLIDLSLVKKGNQDKISAADTAKLTCDLAKKNVTQYWGKLVEKLKPSSSSSSRKKGGGLLLQSRKKRNKRVARKTIKSRGTNRKTRRNA